MSGDLDFGVIDTNCLIKSDGKSLTIIIAPPAAPSASCAMNENSSSDDEEVPLKMKTFDKTGDVIELSKNPILHGISDSPSYHSSDPSSDSSLQNIDYYTVDEAISFIGNGPFQYRLFLFTGMLWASDAMEMMLLAFLLPLLRKEWNLSSFQSTFIAIFVFIGMLFGALIIPSISDKFGRKYPSIISIFGLSFSAIISGFSTTLAFMCATRFMVGFFIGGGVVAFTLFAEFLPSQIRGKLLIIQSVFWTAGVLTSVSLAWITFEYLDWRWYLILSAFPLLLVSVFAPALIPESPRFLWLSGRHEECQQLLSEIAKYNHTHLPPNAVLIRSENASEGSIDSNRGILWKICNPIHRYTSILLYILYSICVFNSYGLSWMSVRYFSSSFNKSWLYWEVLLATSAEIPALIIGVFIIDRFGRKNSMSVTFFMYFVCAGMLVFYDIRYNYFSGIFFIFMSRMWMCISFIILGIFMVEYYPTSVRATAFGGAVSLGRIAGIATTFTSQTMDISLAMYLYSASGFLAFICAVLLPTDTANYKM